MSDFEFLSDPGPEFDPEHSPEPPDVDQVLGPAPGEQPADEGWDVEQIRNLLITQGSATNWLFRLTPDDDSWKHTEEDLRAISAPLARILNRYDATRAAAAAGDEIALGAAVVNYGARNYQRRRRLIVQLRAEAQPQPITGVPAPAGTGPETDPEWERVMGAPPNLTPKGHR